MTSFRITTLLSGLFALSALAAACSSAQTPPKAQRAPDAVVGMTNTLRFEPDTVRVPVGGTVEWRNTSLLVHTVTGDPAKATLEGSARLPEGAEPFDSGNLEPKATFRHTFTVPGTYGYFCIPHEGAKMKGVVIVTPKK
ncbi:cupredoxin domain-containing protein [Rhodocaloribacter sp.]